MRRNSLYPVNIVVRLFTRGRKADGESGRPLYTDCTVLSLHSNLVITDILQKNTNHYLYQKHRSELKCLMSRPFYYQILPEFDQLATEYIRARE